MYAELERALIANDCETIVNELAHWNEEERAKAWKQIGLIGEIRRWRRESDPTEKLSTAAQLKQQELCRIYGDEVVEQIRVRIDPALDMVYVGLSPTPAFPGNLFGNKKLQVRVAKLLVDRRPPWLADWYRSMTQDLAWNMDYVVWVCLFQAGLIPEPEENSEVLQRLFTRFPDSFEACPVESKWTLRELPALRLSVVNVCEIAPRLAGDWAPAASWLSENELIDRGLAVQNALKVLKKTKKRADRRSLMRFVRAIDATGLELLPMQSDLVELLQDKLLDIAGNAILELTKVAKCGRLSPDVLSALPRIFADKTKLYADKALDLARLFANDSAESGRAMLVAVAALDHANGAVQQTALQVLNSHLRAEHTDAWKVLHESRERLSRHLGNALDDLLDEASAQSQTDTDSSRALSSTTSASPKEFQQIQKALTSASTGRFERIKTAFHEGILRDARFREALLGAIEDRNLDLANFIADHVLPTLEPSVLPDLKAKLNLKGKLAHGRRLRLIHKLAPAEARPLVLQAMERGSVEVKTDAILCLQDSDEDWPRLVQAFGSDNQNFRVAARRALFGMRSSRAIQLQLQVLDSDEVLLVLDSILQNPIPEVVSQARQFVQQKLTELLATSNGESRLLKDPQLVVHLQIAASQKDAEAADLLIECLRSARKMTDRRTSISDLEFVALDRLASGFEQGLRILIQNRDEICITHLRWLFRIARERLAPEELFQVFAGYLQETEGDSDPRAARANIIISGEICDLDGDKVSDYLNRLHRNRDLHPGWLDMALKHSLYRVVLSLLVPGHLDTWNYLLEIAENEQAQDLESRYPTTVLGLLLSEYPGAAEICMSVLREAYCNESYNAQRWLYLASLLSSDACDELTEMLQDSRCPDANKAILASAIQDIRTRAG